LFDEYENNGSDIQTIKVDEYFEEGWYDYDHNVSDHRPVGLKIKTDGNLGFIDLGDRVMSLSNYPNPFKHSTTISFDPVKANAVVEIYNLKEQIIQKYDILNNQASIIWDASNVPAGVYYAKLILDGKVRAIRKMIVTN